MPTAYAISAPAGQAIDYIEIGCCFGSEASVGNGVAEQERLADRAVAERSGRR